MNALSKRSTFSDFCHFEVAGAIHGTWTQATISALTNWYYNILLLWKFPTQNYWLILCVKICSYPEIDTNNMYNF